MQITQILEQAAAGLWANVKNVWADVWWIAVPLIAFFIFWEFWVLYIRFRFIIRIKWILLEIKVPKNVLKTPKAMEQIFAAAHAPYSYGLRFTEKYWEGLVEYWMSFEIVGRAGESHFYLRLPKQFKNLMESAIYAQYPEAEITEVEDYIKQMPYILPNKTYDLYGYELIFRNNNFFPVRTYPMFEESIEERRVDPVAGLLETMSKLNSDEQIWIQILTRPTGDDWKKEGEAHIAKMTGLDSAKKKEPWFPGFGLTAREIIRSPLEHPSLEVEKKKDERGLNFKMLLLTPGQKEMVEGIERKIAKLGFETTIRFIFIDKRDAFRKDNVAAITGFFRQFNTQNLNLFRPDKNTMTGSVHYLFTKLRLHWRKRVIYERYRDLIFSPRKMIMNIEELATVYHFPIGGVEPVALEKVESRKGGPPARVPILE